MLIGIDVIKQMYDVYRSEISLLFVLFENIIRNELIIYENWKPILYNINGFIIHAIDSVNSASSVFLILRLKHLFIAVIVNRITVLVIEALPPVRKR